MLEKLTAIAHQPALPDTVIASERITIRPLAPEARFKLRLRAETLAILPAVAAFTLDLPVNRFAAVAGRRSMRLGPDEWILEAPDADAELVAAELARALAPHFHSLVDIGHRHASLEICGAEAANVLNAGCALDLALKAFPVGMASRTLLGKAEIILLRIDDRPAWQVECWRSFAPYVMDFLAEAAREFLPE